MQNVVQLEFFHVGRGDTLKTVIRLFDDGQHMERLVRKWQAKRQSLRRIRYLSARAYGWGKIFFKHQYRKLLRQYSRKKELEERLERAKVFLDDQIDLWEEVAIEMPDHSFRTVQDDELNVLRSAIRTAQGAGILVFEPTSLCANEHKLIAQAI